MSTKEKTYYPYNFDILDTSDLDINIWRSNQYMKYKGWFWTLGEDSSNDTLFRKSLDSLSWSTEQTITTLLFGGLKVYGGEQAVMRQDGANMVIGYCEANGANVDLIIKTYTSATASSTLSITWDTFNGGSVYKIYDMFKLGVNWYFVVQKQSSSSSIRIINFTLSDAAGGSEANTDTYSFDQVLFGTTSYGRGVVSNSIYYFNANTYLNPNYFNSFFSFQGTTYTQEYDVNWTVTGASGNGTLTIKGTTLLFLNAAAFFITIEDFTEWDSDKVKISKYTSLSNAIPVLSNDDSEDIIGVFGKYASSYQYWRIGKTGDIYKSHNIPYTGAVATPNFGIGNFIACDNKILLRQINTNGQIKLLSTSGSDFAATYNEFNPEGVRLGSQMLRGNKMNFSLPDEDDFVIDQSEYIEIYEKSEVLFEDDFEADTLGTPPANWDVESDWET